MRPASMRPAMCAVRLVRSSYSGPSWTASSGSGVPSATPCGVHRVSSTRARSGRLGTSSVRVSPVAGALLELGAGAPDDTGLPRSRAGGDVAEAIGGGLHSTGVAPVRLVCGAIALDHLRLAVDLLLELRLDLVGRARRLPAARGKDRRGEHSRRQRESPHASHGMPYTRLARDQAVPTGRSAESRRWDSNPRPTLYKSVALPAELLRPAR